MTHITLCCDMLLRCTISRKNKYKSEKDKIHLDRKWSETKYIILNRVIRVSTLIGLFLKLQLAQNILTCRKTFLVSLWENVTKGKQVLVLQFAPSVSVSLECKLSPVCNCHSKNSVLSGYRLPTHTFDSDSTINIS